jgi:hypothetical protein
MHQNFGDPRNLPDDRILNIMSDRVTLAHCQVSIHDDMQVGLVTETDFTDEALLQPGDPGHSGGETADFRFDCRRRRSVQ